ncbi:hypothetical protein JYG23_12300 [Sedimentibacter sp. zth1]|uniref:hypothetical protein n=1 Tax=Sedimentibacter sp. zth1 TaxID=2816908 RepID=UPI001A927DE2|nr:hypothetical protein [Sedimentibacter sp. zth1]QSX05449.1 hypothetical protein JYG23_12300 [Sedimentibacter sp. zth1]
MKRINLECSNCGSNDFEVEIQDMIPTGLAISCNVCGCITPLVVKGKREILAINNEKASDLYDLSFREDITDKMINNIKNNK